MRTGFMRCDVFKVQLASAVVYTREVTTIAVSVLNSELSALECAMHVEVIGPEAAAALRAPR